MYKEQRGFTYDTLTNSYVCSQGNRLVLDRLLVGC